MNNSVCPEVLEEVAALPAASLSRLAAAREYSQFAAELSPETLRHLPNCDFCHEEIALLTGAIATLGALPAPALPPDFAARISKVIADTSQDAIVSPEIAVAETSREYSQTSTESAPNGEPPMIAPPLPRAAKPNWRARFGLEKIGGAPRRSMKIAWASGSVLAAFVLVLATQIEPPSMMSPRDQSAVADSAPAPASTREEASEKSGVKKEAAQKTPGTPAKPNTMSTKTAAPRIGAAPKSAPVPTRDAAPPQNVPFGGSELIEPPTIKNSDNSAPRVGLASPSLPLRRTAPKPKSASGNVVPQFAPPPKPRDAVRKTSPSTEAARKTASVTQPRVLAQSSPEAAASRDSQIKSGAPQADRKRAIIGSLENRPAPAGAAPPRDDDARFVQPGENFVPPAAVSAESQNRESAAPPGVASTRDAARRTQKMRGAASAENRESESTNDSADLAAPTANARSGAFAAPSPAARNRAEKTPILLSVEVAAPRDIERARLRLELPRGAKLQNETPANVIWSGTLQRGENAAADVKIVTDADASSQRARAFLESRERDGWRIVATKNIEWKAP